jgi:predicted RND superfamily exporter protein
MSCSARKTGILNQRLSSMASKIDRYIDWVESNRYLLITVVVLVASVAGIGLRNLSIDNDYRGWVSEDYHERQLLDDLDSTFEKENTVIFIVNSPESALAPEYLRASRYLTEAAWLLPHVSRVDSINNYQDIQVEDDDVTVNDLVPVDVPVTSHRPEDLADKLFSNPALVNRLISGNGKHSAVIASVSEPANVPDFSRQTTEAVRQLAQEFRQEFPDIKLRLQGTLMVNDAFTQASKADVMLLFPLMYLIFFVGVYLWIRSIKAVFICWAMISLSMVTTLGIVGWSGVSLNGGNASAPTIILTLILANCIHIFTLMIKRLAAGENQSQALRSSFRSNMRPIFLTMITTVLGFSALSYSDSPPYISLGLITGMGVAISWLYLMVFVPAVISIIGLDVSRGYGSYSWTTQFANFVVSHYRLLGIAFLGFAIMLTSFIPKIELNDDPLHYIDESLPFRQDANFVREEFWGAYAINMKVPSAGEGGVSDPEYLNGIEKLSDWLYSWPNVTVVNSFVPTIKSLNEAFHGDDPAYHTIPQQRDLVSQYILLYEMSLPYGHSLDNIIDIEKSSSRVDVYFDDVDFQTIRHYTDRVEGWIEQNLPPYMATEGAGPSVLFAYITERNIISMLKSTTLCFLIITLIIMVSLGDWRAGLYSIISNILPLLMAYGLWAIVVTKAGLAISLVAALGIGIIVDDTIHFLNKYFHARKSLKLSPEDAVRHTFEIVGPALIGTSLILVAGFSLLTFSDFEINSAMGMFTAVTVLFAILADFILLPAALLHFDRQPVRAVVTEQRA